MQPKLRKYTIGFAILGAFTLVMLIIVLVQASSSKQDTATYNKATSIADKLNSYSDDHGSVPGSLAAAGINNVPTTITYKKVSSDKYQFCVTYKSAATDFNAGDEEEKLLTAGANSADIGGVDKSSADGGYLYIGSNHGKGQDCQTVTIVSYLDDSGSSSTSTSGDSSDNPDGNTDTCNQKYPADNAADDQAYSDCIDGQSKLEDDCYNQNDNDLSAAGDAALQTCLNKADSVTSFPDSNTITN